MEMAALSAVRVATGRASVPRIVLGAAEAAEGDLEAIEKVQSASIAGRQDTGRESARSRGVTEAEAGEEEDFERSYLIPKTCKSK